MISRLLHWIFHWNFPARTVWCSFRCTVKDSVRSPFRKLGRKELFRSLPDHRELATGRELGRSQLKLQYKNLEIMYPPPYLEKGRGRPTLTKETHGKRKGEGKGPHNLNNPNPHKPKQWQKARQGTWTGKETYNLDNPIPQKLTKRRHPNLEVFETGKGMVESYNPKKPKPENINQFKHQKSLKRFKWYGWTILPGPEPTNSNTDNKWKRYGFHTYPYKS